VGVHPVLRCVILAMNYVDEFFLYLLVHRGVGITPVAL